jgi:arylsulfatase A-like enzyme
MIETQPSRTFPPRKRQRSETTVPNVVMIVLDDLGFADLGCYGSASATPNIDSLAQRGLRYNNFHVTAVCSSTRACLLTGRNHHAVGMGFIPDYPLGTPGYTGRIPRSAAGLARLLRDAGYSTFAVGKWHLVPGSESRPSGPFEQWPLAMGFERFYGFLMGGTDQWTPELVQDNAFVDQPLKPEEGYHLTEDLASQAVRLIKDQRHDAPDKPFFLYFATGAVHFPHQVPSSWVEPYQNHFDHGWEALREATFLRQQRVPSGTVLTERPPWVPQWRSVSLDERRLLSHQMEIYGGFSNPHRRPDRTLGGSAPRLRHPGQYPHPDPIRQRRERGGRSRRLVE